MRLFAIFATMVLITVPMSEVSFARDLLVCRKNSSCYIERIVICVAVRVLGLLLLSGLRVSGKVPVRYGRSCSTCWFAWD